MHIKWEVIFLKSDHPTINFLKQSYQVILSETSYKIFIEGIQIQYKH